MLLLLLAATLALTVSTPLSLNLFCFLSPCVAGYVRGSHLWHMCDVSISCCVIFIFIFFMLILQRVWGKQKKRAEGELCYAVPSPDYVKSRKSQIKCEALFALLFRGDALPMFCYV